MIKSPLNAVHNSTNANQGHQTRALVVCSAGLLRSPTVARILQQKLGWNVRCAGSSQAYALVPLSTALMTWAHHIIFVDNMSFMEAQWTCSDKLVWEEWQKKIIVWDIPDDYDYMHPDLVAIVERKIEDGFDD